jgi:hypothetical protein
MKSIWKRYAFTNIEVKLHDPKQVTLRVWDDSTGHEVTMFLYPHEARAVADMIYKVSTDGGLDE